ncbi:MAG: hypothetical protein ACYCQK_08390 [Acidiferrobacteraceae bacterium]
MTAQRMVYLTASLMTLLGIALTGFGRVSVVLYIPAVMLAIAGITGFCPGVYFWKRCGFK